MYTTNTQSPTGPCIQQTHSLLQVHVYNNHIVSYRSMYTTNTQSPTGPCIQQTHSLLQVHVYNKHIVSYKSVYTTSSASCSRNVKMETLNMESVYLVDRKEWLRRHSEQTVKGKITCRIGKRQAQFVGHAMRKRKIEREVGKEYILVGLAA